MIVIYYFAGVDGQHEHEIESPSFFNTAEVELHI